MGIGYILFPSHQVWIALLPILIPNLAKSKCNYIWAGMKVFGLEEGGNVITVSVVSL